MHMIFYALKGLEKVVDRIFTMGAFVWAFAWMLST
jgi:hypothetical protein